MVSSRRSLALVCSGTAAQRGRGTHGLPLTSLPPLSGFRVALWREAPGRRDGMVPRGLCPLHHQPCGRGGQCPQDGASAGGDGRVALARPAGGSTACPRSASGRAWLQRAWGAGLKDPAWFPGASQEPVAVVPGSRHFTEGRSHVPREAPPGKLEGATPCPREPSLFPLAGWAPLSCWAPPPHCNQGATPPGLMGTGGTNSDYWGQCEVSSCALPTPEWDKKGPECPGVPHVLRGGRPEGGDPAGRFRF